MFRKYLVTGVFILGFIGLIYLTYYMYKSSDTQGGYTNEPVMIRDVIQRQEDELETGFFTGKLEAVNTGCFADGECSVVVDGKKVTVLMGWSRDTVGSVQGVEGFGDLERYIGSEVEVYAQLNLVDSYTLYGSDKFYMKLLSSTSMGASAQDITVGGKDPDVSSVSDDLKTQISRNDCIVGGCSSQLCGEAKNMAELVSTCEYRPQYACYKSATCERQENDQCGWTMTTELTQCLRDLEDRPVM